MTMLTTATLLNHDPTAARLAEALFAAGVDIASYALPAGAHARVADLIARGAVVKVEVTIPTGEIVAWLAVGERRLEVARVRFAVGGHA